MTGRLLKPRDIEERYGVSAPTARAYMRRMRHTEHPLRVREADADAWDLSRTYEGGEGPEREEDPPKKVRRRKVKLPQTDDRYQIPRRRPA